MRRVASYCFIVNRQAWLHDVPRRTAPQKGSSSGLCELVRELHATLARPRRQRSTRVTPGAECDLRAPTTPAAESPRRGKKTFSAKRLGPDAAPRGGAFAATRAFLETRGATRERSCRKTACIGARHDARCRHLSRRRASNHCARSWWGNASHRGLVLATVRLGGSRCEVLAQIVRSYR
jgi:hypothetical protein